MNILNRSALAIAVSGVVVLSANADLAINAETDLVVNATINEMITIQADAESISFDGETDVADWVRTMRFEVRRQGATYERSMPYSLKVTNSEGRAGNSFRLKGINDTSNQLRMDVNYTHGVNGGWISTYLPVEYNTNMSGLYTSSGIGLENYDPNLELEFVIPQSEIEKAIPDEYKTIVTVMVAAE